MSTNLTFKDLRNPVLHDALRRMYTFVGFKSVQDSYLVSRVIKEVEEKQKEAQVEWDKIVGKFADKDEAGNMKVGDKGEINIPESVSVEFQKTSEDFDKTVVQLEKGKLNGRILDAMCAVLSPAHIDALEGLREGPAI